MRPVRKLLHVFPTFEVGGAQARFAAVANHFGSAAQHVVVPMDGRTGAAEKLDPGLDLVFVPPPRDLSTGRMILHARACIREIRPDVLVTSNWGSMDWAIAALGTGVQHLHTEDGFGPEEQDRQIPRRAFTRFAVLRSSQIVLPSRNLLRIATRTWRLPPRNLHYVPNGIDVERFHDADAATLPQGDGPVIGTVAALRPEKNLSRLLEAFAELRRKSVARLVIVGDGGQRPELERQAAALGIGADTTFVGHTRTPENYVKAFDIFALTSDTEQMPLSVLEAMAAGLPVIATDVGDVRTMVSPENVPFVVPRNASAIADALGVLVADPLRASAVGRANSAHVRANFSQKRMFSTFGELLGIEGD